MNLSQYGYFTRPPIPNDDITNNYGAEADGNSYCTPCKVSYNKEGLNLPDGSCTSNGEHILAQCGNCASKYKYTPYNGTFSEGAVCYGIDYFFKSESK